MGEQQKSIKRLDFIIQKIEGFFIVRDDLYVGGTKKRAFEKLIEKIPNKEFVYGCDYKGHASYAIALTALEHHRKAHFFFMGPKQETEMFKKVTLLPNVSYEIKEEVTDLKEMAQYTKHYAEKTGAFFLPLGLDFEEFKNSLRDTVAEANIHNAPELWVLGGTGNLARALQAAYPHIPMNVVNLRSVNGDFGNPARVFDAIEEFSQDAELSPPYPTVSNYDAKIWRFVKQYGKPGAYIWNVSA